MRGSAPALRKGSAGGSPPAKPPPAFGLTSTGSGAEELIYNPAMSSLAAFVHHLAAFTLVAALAIEFVLIRDELTARSARRIRIADAVFGAASGVLVVVGLLRGFYLENGAAYYFHNAAFLLKMALFS